MARIARTFASLLLLALAAEAPQASPIGRDGSMQRTGWYPDQFGLLPDIVSSGAFGPLFSTPVNGQVYGQPLVWNGTLLVVTQADWAYGLDPASGEIRWSRNVGTPWNSADVGCTDISPVVGITSTPVIDDATGIAYLTAKSYTSGSSGPTNWTLHAIDVATGAEQSAFPVALEGVADNAPGQVFSPTTQNQRPGLLLMDGVVYAAFGSVCDIEPFQGWVFGVSTTGAIRARWTDRTVSDGSGIWMAGSGLMSDGPGQILFSTGNGQGGTVTMPTPGHSPPPDLGEAIVRMNVAPDGSLYAVDFFTPHDASVQYDTLDADLGSGGVVALPNPPFGTASFPNLIAQAGKPCVLYLLDGNSLGGYEQGEGLADNVVQEIDLGGGVWSRPAVYGGDGGWLYIETANGGLAAEGGTGFLQAYHFHADNNGRPGLTLAALSSDRFGFSSSAPVVTSVGTVDGTAVLWVVWNPNATGVGAQLRAYDAIPQDGMFVPLYSAPIGMGSKFNPPGIAGNRVYVGTRDGKVLGFGVPAGGLAVAGPRPAARLGAARPNPFASGTSCELALAQAATVRLVVFDASGRRVRSLLDGALDAGPHDVRWDGRDETGAEQPTGLYFVRLDASGAQQVRRVLLVR